MTRKTPPVPDRSGGVFAEQREPIAGKQLDWLAVTEFVDAKRRPVSASPVCLPGSPEWCRLADDDFGKVSACLVAASYWAFEQAHRADLLDELGALAARKQAALAISAAEDWARVAKRISDRVAFDAAHPYLKRVRS